jgi:hypothetical protein
MRVSKTGNILSHMGLPFKVGTKIALLTNGRNFTHNPNPYSCFSPPPKNCGKKFCAFGVSGGYQWQKKLKRRNHATSAADDLRLEGQAPFKHRAVYTNPRAIFGHFVLAYFSREVGFAPRRSDATFSRS